MIPVSQDVDAARAFYTRISRVYDALADHDEHRAREVGLSLLDARPEESILEIGFGTGSSIVPLATAVGASGKVLGVDISPGMLAVTEERVRRANPGATIDLRVAAVPPVPFVDASVDGVFMAFTLELFPDDTISAVLLEARRALRAKGRLAVVSMALGSDEERHRLPERMYVWMHQHFPHIIDCRPIDVEQHLKDSGFTVLRTTRIGIWGLPVVAALAR
jgi:ubiquinone/menaquinone biosynthesis C-methylase UbiE